ncbi:DinB family protein [Muriicola sp. Z0-33]|uniref:DinB family protein n=1 Tax=Muriicola sp. Z0-33 TaxID=2816957 RepID=UPI002237A930|nr:DUF1572 domain-containing protein [Muriicola sp. Z0-33]MCW5516727.1 DUF1572 family protein [Muriicola sp. Z0-33]
MKKANELRQEIIENALYRLDESTRMIRSSLSFLQEEDIWKKPNPNSNSVGNLILHLCGNMHQYVLAALGNTEDIRERDSEFSSEPGLSSSALIDMLQRKVDKVKETISSCTLKNMLFRRKVQGFNLSGAGIIMHVVEHYSYHTGQIAYWTKILKDQDLGFYDGIDLTTKNN